MKEAENEAEILSMVWQSNEKQKKRNHQKNIKKERK
jgi:hypothetical protein